MVEPKNKWKMPVTDDKHIEGVKRIDASPEDTAQALCAEDRQRTNKTR